MTSYFYTSAFWKDILDIKVCFNLLHIHKDSLNKVENNDEQNIFFFFGGGGGGGGWGGVLGGGGGGGAWVSDVY